MTSTTNVAGADGTIPAPVYQGLHHAAFLCRDPEETWRFYEQALGFTLAAAVVLPSRVGLAAAYAAELQESAEPVAP